MLILLLYLLSCKCWPFFGLQSKMILQEAFASLVPETSRHTVPSQACASQTRALSGQNRWAAAKTSSTAHLAGPPPPAAWLHTALRWRARGSGHFPNVPWRSGTALRTTTQEPISLNPTPASPPPSRSSTAWGSTLGPHLLTGEMLARGGPASES